jgi:hypothetical protein
MQMSKAGYRTKEPVDIPAEQPMVIREIIEVYLKELGYTVFELCNLLSIRENEFEKLYSEPAHIRLAN